MLSLAQDIREYALDIGFDSVGFTTAEPFEYLAHELDERREMYSWVSENLLNIRSAADPKTVLPSGKSMIVLMWDYYKKAFPVEFLGKIGKSYQVRPYSQKRILSAMIKLLKDFVKQHGIEVGMRPALPDRQAAMRAGLGAFGRNTFIYANGIGSYVAIVTMVVDCDLGGETNDMKTLCPDDCRKCIEACPTGALYEPFRMNPLKCIAFHTYGTGNFPGVPEEISCDAREKMGTWLYGCDICQDVCPRNLKKQKQKLPPDFFLEEMTTQFTLTNLLNMNNEFYLKKVQPFFFGYIWDKKFMQRNAAIALGNIGDIGAVPHLKKAMENPEEIVRIHTAWALGKIKGEKSRIVLEACRGRETSPKVIGEIQRALELSH